MTYKGPTPQEDYAQLLSFLDEVFFTDDDPATKRDFLNLLPKLYKPEYDPCSSNFIVKEGDAIKGAVGLYYTDVIAGGDTLRCGGIGNVAVHRDSRSKGYMIECMNMALKDMMDTGTDFGFLGGQRQRYAYFSFEPAGVRYDFSVNQTNLRHCKCMENHTPYEVRKLTADDTDTLAAIDALLRKEPYCSVHPSERMFDILCSWRNTPYAAFDNGVFKGFFTLNYEGNLADFKAADVESINGLILAIFDTVEDKSVGFSVAPYDTDCLDHLTKIAESCSIRHSECYTVLNFANIIRAMLKVRAATEPMADGEINLLIHGYAGDEHLSVRMRNNAVFVEPSVTPPDAELDHHAAIRFLFSLASAERRALTLQAAQWFPLPLHCFGYDSV